MTMVDDGFQVQDEKATREEFASDSNKIDELWVARIAPIAVGQSFTANRPETENARAFKKRINRAAAVSFKNLDWKARDTNLPDGVEATHWVAKVKSIDLKAKAEAEAKLAAASTSQNGTNGTQEANQPTGEQVSTPTPPETSNEPEPAQSGPRANRPR